MAKIHAMCHLMDSCRTERFCVSLSARFADVIWMQNHYWIYTMCKSLTSLHRIVFRVELALHVFAETRLSGQFFWVRAPLLVQRVFHTDSPRLNIPFHVLTGCTTVIDS